MRLQAVVLAFCLGVVSTAAAQSDSSPPAPGSASADPQRAARLVEQARQLGNRQATEARTLLEQAEALDPDNVAVLLPLAEAQVATRQIRNAYRTLAKVLNKEPRNPDAARLFGVVLEARKDTGGAAKAYLVAAAEGKDAASGLKAGRLAPESDPVTVFEGFRYAARYGKVDAPDLPKYGSAAMTLEKFQDAKEIYEQLLRTQPNDATARLNFARAALATKDFDAAAVQFAAIAAQEPANAEALEGLADIARAKGDATEEEARLRALVAVDSDHATVHKRLAVLLEKKGDAAGALEAWKQQVRVAKDDVDANAALARSALAAGDHASATAHATVVVTQQPKAPAGQLLLGQARILAGDCAGAVKPLEAGLAATEEAQPRAHLGACLFQQKQTAKARQHLADALGRDGKNPLALETLAAVAEIESKFAEAADLLARAAELGERPQDADFQARVADLHLRANAVAKAEPFLDKTLAIDAQHPQGSLLKGRILLASDRAVEALPFLATAAQTLPKSADAQAFHATALFHTGNRDGAATAARAALALAPKHPGASEVLGNALFPAKEGKTHLEAALAGTPGRLALQNLAALQIEAKEFTAAKKTLAALRSETDPRSALLRAKVEHAAGDLRAAEAAVAPALLAHPGDAALHELAGNVAFDRNQADVALERLRKAAALGAASTPDPISGNSLARLTGLLTGKEEFEAAVKSGRDALSRGYDEADVRANLGYALFRTGDTEGSKAELAMAVKKGAKDKTTNLVLGQIALAEQREEEALGWFDKALAADSEDPTANGLSGTILVKRAKYEDAVPRLEKAFKAKPEVQVGTALARACLSTGRHVRAQKVIDSLPDGSLAPEVELTFKGRISHALGNYKRADEHFAKALEASPEDADANFYRGQNFLKLPHYDNAIAHLERAARADPGRPEIAHELARLYAESNQQQKAAEALARAEELEERQVEERRKQIPADQIRRVVVSRFKNDSKQAEDDWMQDALSRAIANDLGKSPYIQILERDELEKVKAEGLKQLLEEDSLDVGDAAQFGRLAAADSVLVGSFLLAGETLQVNARMVDISTGKVGRSGSATGRRDDFTRLQKNVALELLGQYVPLTEEDRAAVARGGGQNVESLRLMTEATRLERAGDLRGAQALYREAVQADQGSAAALAGLARNLDALGVKNRIAIADFQKGNTEADDWIGLAIHNTLSSKLPQVQGIQILDRQKHSAIDAEKLLAIDEDNVDQSTLPEFGKELVAGCVLVGSYHTGDGKVLINARLIDVEDQKILLGDLVTGPVENVIDLSNELAEKIARRLVGAPSDEELAQLRQKQEYEAYKREMQELARFRAEEAARKAEEERLASLPEDSPERRTLLAKLEEKRKDDRKKEEKKEKGEWQDAFWAQARLGLGGEGTGLGGLGMSLYGRQSKGFRWGWTLGMDSSNFFDQGRGSQNAAYAFYDLGLDMEVRLNPFEWGALTLGANASVGQAQSRGIGFQDTVQTGWAAALTPRVGLLFRAGDWSLNTDLGRRFIFDLLGDAETDPLGLWFVQAGISHGMEGSRPRAKTRGHVAYRAHTVLSTGIDAYRRYGNLGGLRYTHGLTIGTDSNFGTQGLYLAYANVPASVEDADAFGYGEVGWDMNFRTFKGDHLFNPVIGFRIGVAGYGDGDEGLYDAMGIGLTGAARVGVDITTKYLLFTPSFGYDYVFGTKSSGRTDLGGFTLDLAVGLRL